MKKQKEKPLLLSKQVLQKMLGKKTAALEKTKRELLLEASLEKVRTVAMRMIRPDDMLLVCRIISEQLAILGVKEIRNVQTAIFYVNRGTYMNYEYYAKHKKTFITETIYTNHKIAKAFAAKMLRGKGEISITRIKGKKVKDWLAYQKTTNVFIDRFLEKASSLTYYWHSLGPVALGISTYEPLREDELKLFQRFLNVFELAYTRYLDIEQALAQVREVKIEVALERVRARTMAMKKSEEIQDATLVLFRQFKELGATAAQVSICIFDEEVKNGEMYLTLKGEKIDRSYIMELDKEAFVMKKAKKAFLDKQKNFSHTITGKKLLDYNRWRNSLTGRKRWDESVAVIKQSWHVNGAFFSRGMLGISSNSPVSDEAQKLLERFASVFDGTYTRFLDLQKAEAQAKESQIQLAMERVRARTMAMQRSDELAETATLFFQQFSSLGLLPEGSRVFFSLIDENTDTSEVWTTKEDGILRPGSHRISLKANKHLIDVYESWKARKSIYNRELTGNELRNYLKYISSVPHLKEDKTLQQLVIIPPDRLVFTEAFFAQGTIGIIGDIPLTRVSQNTLMRFSKVFEQTYTRFLDLQKAEAQAREAKIEAALEKVRSRSLAMHHSDELEQVVVVLFDRLIELGLSFDGAFIFLFEKEKRNIRLWIATKHLSAPVKIDLPYDEEIKNNVIIKDLWNAIETGEHIFDRSYSGETKNDYFRYVWKYNEAKIPESIRQIHMKRDWTACLVAEKNSILGFDSWSGHITTDKDFKVLIRFAKVFEQAYTRFLDLQKAEVQAREAQIEASLEKVRASAMAMHNSNDISATTNVVFAELHKLEIQSKRCGVALLSKNSRIGQIYAAATSADGEFHTLKRSIEMTQHPSQVKQYESWLAQENYVAVLSGEELRSYYQLPFFYSSASYVPPEHYDQNEYGYYIPFSEGLFYAWTEKPYSDNEMNILNRFKSIIDLTFRRFFDLLKAEAQAREAQIELGLERVRARGMTMQKSNELSELVDTVFKELTKLDFALTWCIINIIDESSMSNTVWAANPDINKAPESYHMLFEDYPFHHAMMKDWKERKTKSVYTLEGDEKRIYDDYLFSETEFKRTPAAAQAASRAMEKYVVSFSFSNFGGLQTVGDAPLSDANLDILSRFGKVFDLTYTRFNDLKQAEAQTRESQIQLALERVRARTMAMQKSDELAETVHILFQQFKELGESPDQATIGIINEKEKVIEYWVTMYGNQMNKVFKFPFDEPHVTNKIYKAWKKDKKSLVIDLRGNALSEFMAYRAGKGGAATNPNEKRRIINVAFFSIGLLNVQSNESRSQESIQLLERFAKVFDQTYTRFLDLQKAEAQAREAQIQLALERIRARTMAMQKSDELPETSLLLFQQVKELGETTVQNSIGIVNEEAGFVELSTTVHGHHLPDTLNVPIDDPYVMAKAVAAWKAKRKSLKLEFEGQELKNYNEHRNSFFETKVNFPEDQWIVNIIFFSKGWLSFSCDKDISGETFELLKRFAAVFEQTYIRFNDLKQAEAQAREAHIEAALEKVRSRSMGMQKSEELKDVIQVVYEQFVHLNIHVEHTGFIMDYKERDDMHIWLADKHEFPSR